MTITENFIFYICWLVITLFLASESRYAKGCLAFPRAKVPVQLAFGIGLAALLIAAIAAVNIAVAGAFYPFLMFRYAALYGAKNIAIIVSFQLLVAIVEEFFFRGYLLTVQQAKGQPLLVAVLVNGLLFGLLHLATTLSLISFIVSFAIGVIFASARLKFKHCSIYSLILAHLLYNLSIAS